MAKLPEDYIKQRALEALEKQKKAEEKRRKKEKPTEEELIDKAVKAAKQREKRQKEKEEKKKNTPVFVPSEDTEIDKSLAKELKQTNEVGKLEFKQYTPEDKHRKVCVEVEKETKDGVEIRNKEHSIRWSKREQTYFNKQNADIEKYFFKSGSVPKYTKYICGCCGKPKPLTDFHKSYSFVDLARMDDGSQLHKPYCKECAKKIFFYHYYETCEKNEELAMERFCCDTNTYWDVNCYIEARRLYEVNPTSVSIINEYIGAVGRDRVPGKTYWDSPTIKNRIFADGDTIRNANNKIIGDFAMPLDWKKEEVQVRKKIIKLFRYDPFETETDEAKKIMYRNLELMIDDTMEVTNSYK